MIKKALHVMVFVIMLLSVSQHNLDVQAKVAFKDIPEHDWTVTYIESLVNDSLISGYPDGTFRPNQPITRAEAISLLVKNKGVDDFSVHGKERFKDVKSNFWAYPTIDAAAQKGWVSGYSDGTYRPHQSITRAESAVLLAKIYDIKEKDTSLKFNDVPPAFWAYHGIKALADNSIVVGDSLQSFSPNKMITRAEFCAFLARTLHPELRSNENGNQPSGPTKNESNVYTLEFPRWKVYNDGTHPDETTKGLNQALKWAHEQGYTTFKVPAGTYLVAKGNGARTSQLKFKWSAI